MMEGHDVGDGAAALTLEELMDTLKDSTAHNTLKKRISNLSKGPAPLATPMAASIEARAQRKVQYQETSKGVSKWDPLVQANKKSATLTFGANPDLQGRGTETVSAMVDRFKPQTSLEAQVQDILAASGMGTSGALKRETDELEEVQVSLEELKKRKAELAQLRALAFYDEQKRRRANKIKSKTYRKIKKKQKVKQAEAERERLRAEDPHTARELDEADAMALAKERMTLKHRNKGKWAKNVLKRGGTSNEEHREALNEHLLMAEELRKRMMASKTSKRKAGSDSDGSDESSDSDGDDDPSSVRAKAARDALLLAKEIEDDDAAADADDGPQKGLFSMKFMKDAAKRQREQAKLDVMTLVRELQEAQEAENAARQEDLEDSDRERGRAEDASKAGHGNAKRKRRGSDGSADAEENGDSDNNSDSGSGSGSEGDDAKAGSSVDGGDGDGHGAKASRLGKRQQGSTAVDRSLQMASKAGSATAAKQRQTRAAEILEEAAGMGMGKGGKGKLKGKASGKDASGTKRDRESGISVSVPTSGKGASVGDAVAALAAGSATDAHVSDAAPASNGIGSTAEAEADADAAQPRSKKPKVAGRNILETPAEAAARIARDEQKELIRRAFAGYGALEEDIEQEKRDIENRNAPKPEKEAVGWGSWAGTGAEALAGTSWESLTGKAPRGKNQRKGRDKKGSGTQADRNAKNKKLVLQKPSGATSQRADKDKVGVILSTKRDKKLAKLQTDTVPYPFTSRAQYERSLRAPVGKEWNTSTTVSYMTKPEIVTRAGAIIEPIRFEEVEKPASRKERKADSHDSGKEKKPGKAGAGKAGGKSKRGGKRA